MSDDEVETVESLTEKLTLAAEMGAAVVAENGELREALTKAEAVAVEVRTQMAGMTSTLDRYKEERHESEIRLESLFAERTALQKELAKSESALAAAKATASDAAQRADAASAKLAAASADLARLPDLSTAAADATEARSAAALARAEAAAATAEAEELRAELERMSEAAAAADASGASLSTLQAELKEARADAVRLEAERDEALARVQELEGQLTEERGTAEEMQELLEHARETVAELQKSMVSTPAGGSGKAKPSPFDLGGDGFGAEGEMERQQRLLALLQSQLANKEQSMSAEIRSLRQELVRRDKTRKSGFLLKQTFFLRAWKRCFCVLQTDYLAYGASAMRAFDGIIPLRGATVSFDAETKDRREFCFTISHPNRVYYLAAESREDMFDWLVALQEVIDTLNKGEMGGATRPGAATAAVPVPTAAGRSKVDGRAYCLENERRLTPISSFTPSAPPMRPRFSDEHGNDVVEDVFSATEIPSESNDWYVVINCPEEVLADHVSRVRTTPGPLRPFDANKPPTDPLGWQYALSFNSSADSWEPEQGPTTFVRRRLWRKAAAGVPNKPTAVKKV